MHPHVSSDGACGSLRERPVPHGLSFAEAAAVLGAPVGTVKWRLHEAHAHMRRALAVGDDAGCQRPQPRGADTANHRPDRVCARTRDSGVLPPVRWTRGPAPAALAALRGVWPPAALEVPPGTRVRFAVPSRVAGRHPVAWVGADGGHHLWWWAGEWVWRACGAGIAEVRAAAAGADAGG